MTEFIIRPTSIRPDKMTRMRKKPADMTRGLAAIALAVLAPAAGSLAAGTCDASEHRQFDFWLGAWEVHTPDGKLAGHNTISSEYGGCVLHERYSTGRAYSGESLNIYDPARKVWHQTWVDTSGTLLLLEGGLRAGSMVLEGKTVGADGKATKQRITWTPNTDGSVRQLWEATDAQGRWITAFDGKYTKK